MSTATFQPGSLETAVAALRSDLLAEGGPQISTMRNYRFAILPYAPEAMARKNSGDVSARM